MAFSNGAGDGTTRRARDFVGNHTAQDVGQDAELQNRAQSMVDLYARLDRARTNAEGTGALIYAVVASRNWWRSARREPSSSSSWPRFMRPMSSGVSHPLMVGQQGRAGPVPDPHP